MKFAVHDAEDEWDFDQKFDLVHGRALLTCFIDPKAIWTKAYNALAPGGYFELMDAAFPFKYVGAPPVDSPFHKWNELVIAGAAKSGRPWHNMYHYKRWLEDIGFENVQEKKFYWPINSWAKGAYYKTLGAYLRENFSNGIDALSLKAIQQLGWSVEEVKSLNQTVAEEMGKPALHAYLPVYVVYGRKPQ